MAMATRGMGEDGNGDKEGGGRATATTMKRVMVTATKVALRCPTFRSDQSLQTTINPNGD